MTAVVASALALGGLAGAAALVVAQPRVAWRDAAEHTKSFWLVWLGAWGGLGLVAVAAGPAWSRTGAVAAACLLGAGQPSLLGDVLDVRRLGRLRRRQSWMPTEPPLRPIAWRAPATRSAADGAQVRPA